jgi:hypothetical protein
MRSAISALKRTLSSPILHRIPRDGFEPCYGLAFAFERRIIEAQIEALVKLRARQWRWDLSNTDLGQLPPGRHGSPASSDVESVMLRVG